MIKIKDGFVVSEDIKRILDGINAFDFKYDFIPSGETIKDLRNDFKRNINEVFNNKVTIISEEEMLGINSFIGGEYPHCYIG